MRVRRAACWFVVVTACKVAPRGDPAPSASATALATVAAAPPTPPPPPPVATASAAATGAKPSVPAPSGPAPGDASTSTCPVLRGPIALPIRAPISLAMRGETLDVALNEDGYGRIFSFPVGAFPPSPFSPRESTGAAVPSALAVPCAVAGDRLFCPDRSGAVHRFTRGGEEGRVVASSRSGSRISAALLADSQATLAYLASRKTTEGWVSEAWLAVDDESPLRISDDGSGATAVALASRGSEVIALSVDARMALTAMHARVVTYDKRLKLGEDTVVFVGGPGDRRTAAALVVPPDGPAWSLMPIAKDVGSFGMALVRLDIPPRVDEPAVWSMYPNGLDPAPVAAGSGKHRVWAARVRPETADPASRHVLELGELDRHGGAFFPGEIVPTTGNPTDATLVVDPHDAIWLGWTDAGGSWLEELRCK